MNRLLQLDESFFLWLNNHLACKFLDPIFYVLNWLGNGWIVALLTAIGLLLVDKELFKRHWLWMMLAMLSTGLIVVTLKAIFMRPRPLAAFAPMIASGKVHIHVVGKALKSRSFPSGHTQTAFAVGTYLSLVFRRRWFIFIGLAALVGLARIYSGVHFPLDVVTGAAIGSSGSYLIYEWRNRRESSSSEKA